MGSVELVLSVLKKKTFAATDCPGYHAIGQLHIMVLGIAHRQ